tara:strand:+ start:2452 stop:2604 length:153 start_codon:yes stop_codon:yes gene_type:complete
MNTVIPIEIDGAMWDLVIDRTSQHTVESASGKVVVAFKATLYVANSEVSQ